MPQKQTEHYDWWSVKNRVKGYKRAAVNAGLERVNLMARTPETAVDRDPPTGVALSYTRHSTGRRIPARPSWQRAIRVACVAEASLSA